MGPLPTAEHPEEDRHRDVVEACSVEPLGILEPRDDLWLEGVATQAGGLEGGGQTSARTSV